MGEKSRFQATIRITDVMENFEGMIMDVILLSIRKMLVIKEQKLHIGIKRKVKEINRAYIVIIRVIIEKGTATV